MLYTVIPVEEVLAGCEVKPAPTVEMVFNGVLMEVEPTGAFQAKIVRVISSNPNDYLTARHQPGSVINWT